MLFFQNERNELRILAYDDYHKVEEYEETLLSLENDGFSILDFCLDDYLNDKHVIELNQIIKNNPDECELVVKGNINFEWDNFLRAPKDELFIVTPLTNECKLNHAFIEQIGTLVEAGVKINYILSGKDFTSEYQKNHCLSLHKLSNKSNFTFKQVSFYLNKMIVDVSRSELLISIYEPIEIVSNGSKMGFNEIVYKIKGNTYSKIYDIVNRIENDCEMPKLESPNDIVSLRKNIEDIILLVKDCDSYMQNIDEIGWFGNGGIPELKRLKEVPLANNSENFRIFFDSLNKSLIESLEYNAKIKGKSKYFWNEFRSRYADLHKILDKIKTYRNKCNHLKLDELNRKKYYSFLEHDLNGCIPEFIESGFLIIQQKTISELQTELKRLLLNIRN